MVTLLVTQKGEIIGLRCFQYEGFFLKKKPTKVGKASRESLVCLFTELHITYFRGRYSKRVKILDSLFFTYGKIKFLYVPIYSGKFACKPQKQGDSSNVTYRPTLLSYLVMFTMESGSPPTPKLVFS